MKIFFSFFFLKDMFKIQWDKVRPIVVVIFRMFIDVFNIAEHVVIFYIAKHDILTETDRKTFFFILFAIRGAAALDGCICHPGARVVYNIFIEVAEYVSYMTVLPRTTSLVVSASVFFGIIIKLNLITLILVIKDPCDSKREIILHAWFTLLRVFVYCILYASHLLIVFLEPVSQFKGELYGFLMILGTSFGSITSNKFFSILVKMIVNRKTSSTKERKPMQNKILIIWEMIIFFISIVIYLTMMIVGLVYTITAFKTKIVLNKYDYVVYIVFTVWYSLVFLIVMITVVVLTVLRFRGVKVITLKKIKKWVS